MLDDGVQNGRVYLLFGLPKGFKSGTLLNIGIWACKYNSVFKLKDPSKKPAVLYVTQENSVRETMERFFVYTTGKSVKEYDENEAIRLIRDDITNFTNPLYKPDPEDTTQTGPQHADLFVKYRPNKSINTSDLNTMCDDLETEGYEVVLLIQDYTKRIRPDNPTGDLRIDLGAVVDEFTVIAKTRDIPLISAGQLNREAYRILENSIATGRTDIGKDLSASHVGESALMIENTDYGIIINKEEDPQTSEEYLTFKLIASRAKKPEVSYFVHPFDNGIKLQEDVYLAKSLSKDKIGSSGIDKKMNPNEFRSSMNGQKPLERPVMAQPTLTTSTLNPTSAYNLTSKPTDINDILNK